MKDNTLYIVTPCYNEEEILMDSAYRLKNKLLELIEKELVSNKSKIIFIDDGSKDKTWSLIEKLVQKDKLYGGIKLSKNFGQYAALMAGYMYAKDNADLCISLDVDLQDDIEIIEKMVQDYNEGSEIVFTVRKDRKSDTNLKKNTAKFYYQIMKWLNTGMIPESPDFRLLSKRALKALEQQEDKKPYPRGSVPCIGFKSSVEEFVRQQRRGGKTSYSYPKMIKLAIRSIVKTTNRVLFLPFFVAVIAMAELVIQIPSNIYWVMIFFSLGIIGLYIADIKDQICGGPCYFIDIII
ncbi:glycosyltransferase family 2 protein [Hungatella hathewayi]|uniref:glycosyltransferase family 2 protein n=1 Tax=Hungatella hathewayi TaxID=154046 RepID=UPI00356749E3